MARRYDFNDKAPRAYDHNYEHDVRHQYPCTVPRPQPPFQSCHQPRRSWPPFPRAEDESLALSREYPPARSDTSSEEAQSRGILDQQPIILDANVSPSAGRTILPEEVSDSNSDSSSESIGPSTPTNAANLNRDQRYVYIPKEGIEIPLTYDEKREPKYANHKPTAETPEQGRGRATRPKVETDFESQASLQADTSLWQRAPSPYAFVPQPKPKELHITGHHLLSPETMSPKINLAQSSLREPSRTRQAARKPSRGPQPFDNSAETETDYTRGEPRPSRPSMARHVSAAAYPGEPATPASATNRSHSYHHSSYDSDDDRRGHSTNRAWYASGRDSPDSPRKAFIPLERDHTPRPEKRLSSGLRPVTPPPRARSSMDGRAPPPQSVPLGVGLQAANVMLQHMQHDRRRASPRASPVGSPVNPPIHSPWASPPEHPPSDRDHRGDAVARSPLTPPQTPLQTPLQWPQTPQTPTFLFSESEHERPSRRYDPKSRRTSPLPLPAPTGSYDPQIDVRAPSPANHKKSFSHGTEAANQALYNGSRHLSLAPFDTQPSALKPPTLGQRRRASSNADTRPQFSNNLAPLELDQVSRSLSRSRRPTMPGRAVSVGAMPMALPLCPRPTPVTGYEDWYTLAGGPHTFSVCPTCRDAVSNAGYERHFKPKFRKIADYDEIRCDFSTPWVRMAWTSIMNKRRGDVELLYAIADIVAHERPCPGKVRETRDWYRLTVPETGKSVHDFQICPQCVRSLETLQPTLRGVFHKSHGHHHRQERACSMRIDSKRFTTYLSLLSDTAKHAEEYRRPPNMFRFIGLAHRIAGIPECSRDDMLLDQEWYFIPGLPELTVCEDCYDEAVWPAIKHDLPVATDFKRHPKSVAPPHVGISCQLYSSRMRKVFQEACQKDDMQILRNAAVQRYRVEKDLQARNFEVQQWPKEERMRELAMLVEEWKRWE